MVRTNCKFKIINIINFGHIGLVKRKILIFQVIIETQNLRQKVPIINLLNQSSEMWVLHFMIKGILESLIDKIYLKRLSNVQVILSAQR